jgi:acyl-CoA thioester hydrolase
LSRSPHHPLATGPEGFTASERALARYASPSLPFEAGGMFSETSFPFSIAQDLIWRDMDAFQHVNNAVYFRYFEDVRMAFFARSGVTAHMEQTGVGPILASTRADFRAPLTFPDRVRIGTAIVDLRARRFTMAFAVYSEGSATLAAEGEALLVYYDYRAQKSCEIPTPVREALAPLQRRATPVAP